MSEMSDCYEKKKGEKGKNLRIGNHFTHRSARRGWFFLPLPTAMPLPTAHCQLPTAMPMPTAHCPLC